jgi:predicted dienelactone hydrolase
MFDHYDLMKSNSFPEAPVSGAEGAYPVLLFSPGGGMIHERNFLHVEEMASRGYIVFSLSAPYESWAVIFPDGRVVRGTQLKANPEPTEEDKKREEWSQEMLKRLEASTSIQERKELMRELFAHDPDGIMDRLLGVRVTDARFVRDELERIDAGTRGGRFEGRLDLERVGMFGMSLGAAATGQVCVEDERFKAGVNLDGTQFGTLIDSYLAQPFMFMNSGQSKDHNDFVYDRLLNTGYSVTVDGSSHMDFTDFFYTIPLFKRLAKDAISDDRMYRIVNAYTGAFFDTYLKAERDSLLDGPSDEYPEVEFKILSTKQEQPVEE